MNKYPDDLFFFLNYLQQDSGELHGDKLINGYLYNIQSSFYRAMAHKMLRVIDIAFENKLGVTTGQHFHASPPRYRTCISCSWLVYLASSFLASELALFAVSNWTSTSFRSDSIFFFWRMASARPLLSTSREVVRLSIDLAWFLLCVDEIETSIICQERPWIMTVKNKNDVK